MARSKKAKHIANVMNSKQPKADIKSSFYGLNVSFSFRKYDADASWSASSDRKPSVDNIFKNLRGCEELIGKKHGTNSHYIPISTLSKEAIRRAKGINLDEDELFSLRLQNMVRMWGIIEQTTGCFYIIWFDPEHKVYPV
jgi:hypothetical protein